MFVKIPLGDKCYITWAWVIEKSSSAKKHSSYSLSQYQMVSHRLLEANTSIIVPITGPYMLQY